MGFVVPRLTKSPAEAGLKSFGRLPRDRCARMNNGDCNAWFQIVTRNDASTIIWRSTSEFGLIPLL